VGELKLRIETWQRKDCTIGVLTYGDFQCFTLELPWLDNQEFISCIPRAEGYKGEKFKSNKNGDCIAIINVLDRTHIQIHSGNYTRNVEGCMLVGNSVKFLDSDTIPDVTSSVNTLKALLAILPNTFPIEIV